uniref:Zona pellucida sperm-binding protein 4 n=1 Tax=Clupea pallasii TaxID=30724 RepID=K4Q0T4_CLUPA|nr:egg envelope protein [Clupea pallasii]
MALDKKMYCFGVAFMLLWLGTICSAQYLKQQQWSLPQGASLGASTQWSGFQKTSYPPQKTPQAIAQVPQWPPQKTPQVIAQMPQWPPQKTPQVIAQMPQWPPQKTPQVGAQMPQWPPKKTPQVVAQVPQRTPKKTQQVVAQVPQRTPVEQVPYTPPQKTKTQDPIDPVQTCSVDDFARVSCGGVDTTAAECQAMECCFDGVQCFYGRTVTLYCTRDAQVILVISTDVTLPRLSLETVKLLGGADDPMCSPVESNSAFAVYQFPATACGTTMREEDGYVIYENQMASSYEVGTGPLGSITRDSQYELAFQCRYRGETVLALVSAGGGIEVLVVPPPNPVAAAGLFRVELRLGNGQCTTKGCAEENVAFTSYYGPGDYPVTKVLRDPVYAEVRFLDRTDPNIFLTLSRCWMTTTTNPYSLPQWDVLVDGCPYMDDLYRTTLLSISPDVEFPTHYRRFMLKMFTFVDPQSLAAMQETVFLHCKTFVCKPSAGDSCEPNCSMSTQQQGKRFKRDVSAAQQGETVVVSSGAVIIRG